MQAYYHANFTFDLNLPAAISRSQLFKRLPNPDWLNKGHPIDQSVNWCPNLKVQPQVAHFLNK